jgi:hypothetical protein
MKEILFWIFLSLGFAFTIQSKPHMPDHPLYFSYTFSFDNEEQGIIKKESVKAAKQFNSYIWPTNTKSSKLNIFFTILNQKDKSPFYKKALIYLFKMLELYMEFLKLINIVKQKKR